VLIDPLVTLTAEQVRHVAALARLTLGAEETERMTADLVRILGYVEKLGELDTSGVEPTSHVVAMSAPLRADVVTSTPQVAEGLANAPVHDDGYFVVPAIIE
jgi:aspartyl-tRNA(Asn)/glutamyl-tRNA(Gln) amidotransferase subunit C